MFEDAVTEAVEAGDTPALLAMLRALGSALVAVGVPGSGAACLEEAEGLLEAYDRINVALDRRIARVEETEAYQEVAGHGSARAWLQRGGRMAFGTASKHLANAREYARRPALLDAVAAGALSWEACAVVSEGAKFTRAMLEARAEPDPEADAETATALDPDVGAGPTVGSDVESRPPVDVERETDRYVQILTRCAEDTTSLRDLRKAAGYVRAALDPDPDGEGSAAARADRRRYLEVNECADGGVVGRFVLPPKPAAQLRTLIRAHGGPAGRDDPRTPGQRYADVLGQLLDRAVTAEMVVVVNAASLVEPDAPALRDVSQAASAGDGRPTHDPAANDRLAAQVRRVLGRIGVPDPPTVTTRHAVDVPAERPLRALDGEAREGPGTDREGADASSTRDATVFWSDGRSLPGLVPMTGTWIRASVTRRMAYTSKLFRLVLAAPSIPLDSSRAVRFATPHMRRTAFTLYDTCAYDDCPIPAELCEMDHVFGWSRFRRTRADEIVPACDYHNRDRATHPERYVLERGLGGRWHFRTDAAGGIGLSA